MEIASGCLEAGCAVTLVSQGPPLAQQLGSYLSGVFVAAALGPWAAHWITDRRGW